MTNKRSPVGCAQSSPPIVTLAPLQVPGSPENNHSSLYAEAYREACKAVHYDHLGQFQNARKAYTAVIEMFLALQRSSVPDHRVERAQLTQKLNEYIRRRDQLERYDQGIQVSSSTTTSSSSTTITTTTHPDAQQDALYNNPKFALLEQDGSDDDDSDDEDEESKEIHWLLQKAQFSMIQGDLNEWKGHVDPALEYYLDAANGFKKAYEGLYGNPRRRAVARDLCFEAVDKAEELKALQSQQKNQVTLLAVKNERRPAIGRHRASSTSSVRSNKSSTSSAWEDSPKQNGNEPVRLSQNELDVLKFTSNVNEKIFLPWIDDTDLKEKYAFPTRFVDPEGSLRLSEKQMAKFGGWKRPTDLMKHPRLIRLISSTSIVQDVVTDCSFVASLCVAAAYERKFKKQLITSCIYPQDRQGQPCYNPNGKYVVKLLHNGIHRKIVVDDLLPVSREGTLMCTFSTDKEELWASIIEKAYMKLMGGYDFPGSNSGIDLYSLTGWIPEHIFIQHKHFIPHKVWDRIMEGAKYGDVLVTIATGELSESDADQLGLVPTHAYAVIDIKVVMGKRFLQVKNPWSHKRWQGPYSHLDTVSWTPSLKSALNYDPEVAERNDDGIFWIDYDSVCAHFTSIHLNWNPELFTHKWVLHSHWPEHLGPKKDIYNLGYNPQFSLEITVPDKKPAAVWLLLSKHVMVTEEENPDYITLHIYSETDGQRIYYPSDPFKEGTYVNSPHILVRFNAPPGKSHYTIVVSQHEKARSLYFSLRAWSLAPFRLAEVPMRYPIEQKVIGQWTEQSAGGNASNPTYLHNPQWTITVPPSARHTDTGLLLMLEAPKSFAVNLLVVEGGKRVSSVSVRDVMVDSGPYRHGFCYCEISNIQPGSYTVVASTFETDLIGQFIMTVASNTALQVDAIPAEGAGMFRKVIHGEWIPGYSAMGCPSYGFYGNNPRYLLEIRELTTLRVRLQANKIQPVPSINVAIYEKHPTELFGQEMATSGPYTNVVQGVATSDVVLSQNQTGYIIVVATHTKGIAGEYTMTLYSDRPVNIQNDR